MLTRPPDKLLINMKKFNCEQMNLRNWSTGLTENQISDDKIKNTGRYAPVTAQVTDAADTSTRLVINTIHSW